MTLSFSVISMPLDPVQRLIYIHKDGQPQVPAQVMAEDGKEDPSCYGVIP